MTFDTLRAIELLKLGSGLPDASFREGQEDAIRHVVEGRSRLLVVQKTGWGKSFVYFIAIKLLREAGAGPALLGLTSEANFRDRYLQPGLNTELIEMTIPEKPRSSKQQYRITPLGRQILTNPKS